MEQRNFYFYFYIKEILDLKDELETLTGSRRPIVDKWPC